MISFGKVTVGLRSDPGAGGIPSTNEEATEQTQQPLQVAGVIGISCGNYQRETDKSATGTLKNSKTTWGFGHLGPVQTSETVPSGSSVYAISPFLLSIDPTTVS